VEHAISTDRADAVSSTDHELADTRIPFSRSTWHCTVTGRPESEIGLAASQTTGGRLVVPPSGTTTLAVRYRCWWSHPSRLAPRLRRCQNARPRSAQRSGLHDHHRGAIAKIESANTIGRIARSTLPASAHTFNEKQSQHASFTAELCIWKRAR
jgi:hypothetical protein